MRAQKEPFEPTVLDIIYSVVSAAAVPTAKGRVYVSSVREALNPHLQDSLLMEAILDPFKSILALGELLGLWEVRGDFVHLTKVGVELGEHVNAQLAFSLN